ncbi:NAPDH-dependent diflavin reductase [Exophiala xenobiotica]|nr:NAPDH-dependent diflavin reductase [Exophiala xenobiotica]KAK5208761.1 NAPDH-dependent diflavin reductase [Exophiala xenobiotica]KAK5229780.1 NAPDH-dependent diflavin reductase [Exophiala xenobiotica]KAK5295746.1 NAPDH-dependent diflavin reductase [Exophiala xenobiotica]KAK5492160.1 NAPDH-dependent diflavin reductase [Exophiala xenobiotica]
MHNNGFDHTRSVIVLYGTETGTSQDFAEEIGRCLERLRFDTHVAGLESVNHNDLHDYTLAVFVIATTGQGDFPENARKFWTSLLRKRLSSTTLSGMEYALVGLGDSSYPKFNFAARKLEKRLGQLGATSIIESCEADEQDDEGTDGAVLAWVEQFRQTVVTRFPLGDGQQPIPNDVLLPSKWRLERRSTGAEDTGAHGASNGTELHAPATESFSSESFEATLMANDRVTPVDHFQDVRFMALKTPHTIKYSPGDAIAILPQNMPTDVRFLIERMNWQDVADIPIRLISTRRPSTSNSSHLATSPIFSRKDLTLRNLLTEYLDINAIPRRSFFGAIANYTTDDMHKERLLEFTDPQYLDEYYDYATRPRRSILEILQEFDSVHLPWAEVTNIFPPMRARQFSIASGGRLKHLEDGSTVFELLVAIVKYRTVIKRIREGVSLKTEGRFAKASDMAGKSHLLIGAGTGIAPLRAMIHEKVAQYPAAGRTALIFGCRSAKADYFFGDEWAALQPASGTDGAGLDVITAFSRDQKNKIYIQDRIRERSDLVWEYLRQRHATIIVCGSSGQMPKAVRQALVDALVQQAQKGLAGGKSTAPAGPMDSDDEDEDEAEERIESQEDAEKYLAGLEKEGRYKQETWS